MTSILKHGGLGVFLVLAVFLAQTIYTRMYAPDTIYAQSSQALNFQARLMQANGALVSDGNYSVEFRLYEESAGGSSLWVETQSADVKSGYLSVYLGDNTSLPAGIDWSQQHWLTMNVEGDGEMSPRIRLTAVPFALQAQRAQGLVSGTSLLEADDLLQAAPTSVQQLDASVAGLRFDQTGSGGLAQLQSDGVNRFTVSRSGDVVASSFSGYGAGLTLLDAGNITSGELADSRLSSNVALLDGEQTFSTRITFDSGLTLGSTSTSQAGSLRWTGSDFEGFDGSDWVSLTQGGGLSGSGSEGELAVFDSSGGLEGASGLAWDGSTVLDINASQIISSTPGWAPNGRLEFLPTGGWTDAIFLVQEQGIASPNQAYRNFRGGFGSSVLVYRYHSTSLHWWSSLIPRCSLSFVRSWELMPPSTWLVVRGIGWLACPNRSSFK